MVVPPPPALICPGGLLTASLCVPACRPPEGDHPRTGPSGCRETPGEGGAALGKGHEHCAWPAHASRVVHTHLLSQGGPRQHAVTAARPVSKTRLCLSPPSVASFPVCAPGLCSPLPVRPGGDPASVPGPRCGHGS